MITLASHCVSLESYLGVLVYQIFLSYKSHDIVLYTAILITSGQWRKLCQNNEVICVSMYLGPMGSENIRQWRLFLLTERAHDDANFDTRFP